MVMVTRRSPHGPGTEYKSTADSLTLKQGPCTTQSTGDITRNVVEDKSRFYA